MQKIPHNPNEILPVVNEKDEVIGKATRKEIHEKGLCHREVFVFIMNSENKILLQTRRDNGLLDASSSGHVPFEQGYKDAAIREIGEELGLEIQLGDIKELFYFYHESKREGQNHRKFAKGFIVNKNISLGEFHIDKDEIDEVNYYSLDEIRKLVNNTVKKTTDTLKKVILERYLD